MKQKNVQSELLFAKNINAKNFVYFFALHVRQATIIGILAHDENSRKARQLLESLHSRRPRRQPPPPRQPAAPLRHRKGRSIRAPLAIRAPPLAKQRRPPSPLLQRRLPTPPAHCSNRRHPHCRQKTIPTCARKSSSKFAWRVK